MEIENTSLQEYRTKPGGFSEIKRKVLKWVLIFAVPAITIGIWSSAAKGDWSTVGPTLLIVIPIIIVYTGFSIYRMLRRQKQLFESYRVTITQDSIIRDQLNTPVIMIRREDIKAITRMKNGGLCVKGKRTADRIWIPAQMENYEELKHSLDAISPLEPEKELAKRVLIILAILLLVAGLFFILNSTNNKFLVVISGMGLIALFVTSMVRTQRSRHVDQRAKNGSWFVLVIIFMVLLTMVLKLIAK